jgi:hypothetical protein
MQIVIRTDRYLQISTSQKLYPVNVPLEVGDEELAQLREGLKDTPDLEILERQSKFSSAENAEIEATISSMIGQELDFQKQLLQQAFERFSSPLRQELRLRVLQSLLPEDLKRSLDRILADVEVWDRTYAG